MSDWRCKDCGSSNRRHACEFNQAMQRKLAAILARRRAALYVVTAGTIEEAVQIECEKRDG